MQAMPMCCLGQHLTATTISSCKRGCDWQKFPVEIPLLSLINAQMISQILAAFPSQIELFQINYNNSPATVAGLNQVTMCAVAKKIEGEFRRHMEFYLKDLDKAILKDKGRIRSVEIPQISSILQLAFPSISKTRMEQQFFPNEYGDTFRREWMVSVTILEGERISQAISDIEECAKKCITNIEDAQQGDPLCPDDEAELEQMEKLYTALKPGSQLQLPGLDAAKQYLIGH